MRRIVALTLLVALITGIALAQSHHHDANSGRINFADSTYASQMMQAMVRINDKIPSLRIMLDHLPSFDPSPAQQAGYDAVLKEIHGRPKIYAKLSEIDHRTNPGRGLAAHKARLDQLMATFGADRVVFGTDWPNSWGTATPAQIVDIARAYFATRTREEAEKYFWKNSLNFYKWKKRAKNQPGPG